ncbi:hypothetical protein [Lentzea sp. HUAS12]|uniref:hypothetical protein n=1 Tax=Lentzea sp. HUAS12 TaxID=2951806 RepID=UPI00209FCF77|nr:hypothetical protein [Lentzea sp. HUAS12]USX52730.1 hypothetical protein ND450_01140 [Lentzea sp. HUAS12]
MYVPEQLADRVVVVARDDYVQVADDNPGLIENSQVTLVPVPLLGEWTRFRELAGLDLSIGDAFVRDHGDARRYVPVAEAPHRAAQRRLRLLRTVCQHLGATSLVLQETETRAAKTSWHNDFVARIGLGGGEDAQKGGGLSADLSGETDDRLSLTVEASGRWRGGPADVEAARKAAAAHGDAVDLDVLSLIEQRAISGNQLTSHHVTIDFQQEMTKHFSLISELVVSFEATIGLRALSPCAALRTVFDWERHSARQARFTLEVSFDPGNS